MMCLLLLYDVEKIGYGTWLTKLMVHNSVDRITIDAELRFDFLRALFSKTKSVETDQSVIFTYLQTVKKNDKR